MLKRREWLSDEERASLALPPRCPPPAATVCPVRAVPQHTKPAGELRRGDEVRDASGRWASVSDVQPGGMDGRVRVTLAGPKLLGWFAPDHQMAISPSTAKEWEPRRRQLRGVELMTNVLKTWFPDTLEHGGARDVANQLSCFLPDLKAHELESAIAESLEARGLARPVAASAALRARVAWLMARGGH